LEYQLVKLLNIEHSRLTSLFITNRIEGQPAIPAAFAELIKRYSFAGHPTKIEELEANRITFRLGSFDNVSIESFEIYPDGVAVSAKAPTDLLDAFLTDVTQWMDAAFGLKRIETHDINRLYESTVVVQSSAPLLRPLDALQSIRQMISAALKAEIGLDAQFEPFSLGVATDHTKLPGFKPIPFRVERRAVIAFEKNYYYSQAPLRTADHLKVLESLEKLVA
jgi:hypothetical protein